MRQCSKCKKYMREGIYDEPNVDYFCSDECYSKATGGLDPDGEEVYFTQWEHLFKFVIIEQRTEHKRKKFFLVHPQDLHEYNEHSSLDTKIRFFASITATDYVQVIDYLNPILQELVIGEIEFVVFYASSSSSLTDNIETLLDNCFDEENVIDTTDFYNFVSANVDRLKGVEL